MTTVNDSLRTAVHFLHSADDAEFMKVFPLDVHAIGGRVHLGSDKQGLLHLLVPLQEGAKARPDRSSHRIRIESLHTLIDNAWRTCVDVVCTDSTFESAFLVLAEQMLDAISVDPSQSATACHTVLDRWRAFLDRYAPIMSRSAACGLFAELVVLRDLVSKDPARRLDFWRGPEKASHDFLAGSQLIEVKAITASEGVTVTIHGIEQLHCDNGQELHLVVFRVTDDDNGQRIDDIVEEITALGVSAQKLQQLLVLSGWSEGATTERFVVKQRMLFHVGEEFPKLTCKELNAGALAPGVMRLRYDLDVSALTPLGDADYEELLERMVNT